MFHGILAIGPEKGGLRKRRSRNDAPVAMRENDTITNVRGAIALMLMGMLIFLTFDSEGLRHVTRGLPANQLGDSLVAAADDWHALMLRAGPAHVAPVVHAAFDRVRSIGW